MTTKILVFISMALGLCPLAYADEVCVTNGKELAAHKDDFPKFFQEKEIHFARTEWPTAYFTFKITDDKISGEAKYKVAFVAIKTKGYAASLCYNKDTKEVRFRLENKTDYKMVKVLSDEPPNGSISAGGYELTRKPESYRQAMATLNPAEPSSASAPAEASTNNGAAQ